MKENDWSVAGSEHRDRVTEASATVNCLFVTSSVLNFTDRLLISYRKWLAPTAFGRESCQNRHKSSELTGCLLRSSGEKRMQEVME